MSGINQLLETKEMEEKTVAKKMKELLIKLYEARNEEPLEIDVFGHESIMVTLNTNEFTNALVIPEVLYSFVFAIDAYARLYHTKDGVRLYISKL